MTKKSSNLKGQNAPILIYTDEFAVRNMQQKLEEIIIPALGKVKQAFDKLQIGLFTDAWLKDLLFENMRSVRMKIIAEIEKEMPSRFLQDEAKRKAEQMLQRVSYALADLNNELDRHAIYDLLEYPSVNEKGEIVLTEEAVQSIREANSIYAITPKAKELHKIHTAAAAALDRFFQMVKAEITNNPADLVRFFTIDEEAGKVKPEVIDYEYSEYVTGRVRNFV